MLVIALVKNIAFLSLGSDWNTAKVSNANKKKILKLGSMHSYIYNEENIAVSQGQQYLFSYYCFQYRA